MPNTDQVFKLNEKVKSSKNAFQDVVEQRDQEFENVRKKYQNKIENTRTELDNSTLEMHNQLAVIMENDGKWFEDMDVFKFVSDAIREEGTNDFFYNNQGEPVTRKIQEFFSDEIFSNYENIGYRYGRDEYDHSCDNVAVPRVMMRTSMTDETIDKSVDFIEPYINVMRSYVKSIGGNEAIIKVVEHTLSQNGIITIITPSPDKYKIVKTYYGTDYDMTEEMSLKDILQITRSTYWYEDDANLYTSDDDEDDYDW